MRNTTKWTVAMVALVGVFLSGTHPAKPAQTASDSPGQTKSFQLVYHSDTRGYYRPCG